MRGGVQAVIRLNGGADSGTIGDHDNAAGRRLGADPRRQRSTRHPLALAVLRSLAGLLQPVLLPLLRARVTREEAGLLQARPVVLRVGLVQRTGDAEPKRTRLAG